MLGLKATSPFEIDIEFTDYRSMNPEIAVQKHRRIVRTSLFALGAIAMLVGCAASRVESPPEGDRFGVLVMAHGGSSKWNERVLTAVQPLRDRYPIEVAFGMADSVSLQEGVRKLEEQGVRRVGVVRLFVSGESWRERTEQILGIRPGAPARPKQEPVKSEHAGHSMALWRIETRATFALSQEGLADAPEMGAILADRAVTLSRAPSTEDVLILAHGPGDDAENERWIAKISVRAEAVKSVRPFRRVEVHTLREDWPEKRKFAEQGVRSFVQRAIDENGKAIVIPFRVEGFGPYGRVLENLDYVSDGVGLLPHGNVTEWIERQAAALARE
jgi:sirohydrochlorin cobaltochelatase